MGRKGGVRNQSRALRLQSRCVVFCRAGFARCVPFAKRMSRRWRVVLLRAKGEILGTVEAPDVAAAKAAAAVQFNLDDVQRNRIMVQELA